MQALASIYLLLHTIRQSCAWAFRQPAALRFTVQGGGHAAHAPPLPQPRRRQASLGGWAGRLGAARTLLLCVCGCWRSFLTTPLLGCAAHAHATSFPTPVCSYGPIPSRRPLGMLSMPFNRTAIQGLYCVGDSTFPGQGVNAGVFRGRA